MIIIPTTQACIIWLYGVQEIIPKQYETVEPLVTPWVLPATQIALTGKVHIETKSAKEHYQSVVS